MKQNSILKNNNFIGSKPGNKNKKDKTENTK